MTTRMHALDIEWLDERYAICRLDATAPLPEWASTPHGDLWSVTRTSEEWSIIVREDNVPHDARAERGFVACRVAGTLEFGLTGILARLTDRLASASIPVFALSTFDTDYLLVREADRQRAAEALREA